MNSVNLRTPASPHELFILFNETCICLVMQAVYFGVTLTRLFSVTVACWNHLRTRLKNIVLERRFSNLDMQINYLLKGTIQSNRSRVEPDTLHFFFFFFFFNFYFYFILLYKIALVLPYIDMNPPQVYMREVLLPPFLNAPEQPLYHSDFLSSFSSLIIFSTIVI